MKALTPVSLFSAHLLIVDDSAEELHLLKEMLRGHDFQFSVADSACDAYELALANPPDIILMNPQVAGMDAGAMERRLREHALTADIPVLFLATAKHLSGRHDYERSEVLDFLVKPFTVGQLLEKVRAQLRLSFLQREHGRKHVETTNAGARLDWELIGRAKKHLDEHLAEIRRVGDIARALSTSERRLAQAFQNCLNISAVEYIRQERMRKAKYLLTHTTRSIRTIATTVGFSSAANFSTAFNSVVGTSPSSFRNQALSNALVLDRVLK